MAQVQVQQNENSLFLRHFNVPEAVKQNVNEAIIQTNILFNLEQTTDTQNICNVVRRLFLYNIYELKITRNEFNEDMETLKKFNKKVHKAIHQMVVVDNKVKFTKKFYKLADNHNNIKTRGLYNTFEVDNLFWKKYFNDDELIKQVEKIGVKYFFHSKYSSIRTMIELPLKNSDDYYCNTRDYSNSLSNGIYDRLFNTNSPLFQIDNNEYGYINRALKNIVDIPNYNNIVVQKFLRYNEALEQ
jgi:hypothetical protein